MNILNDVIKLNASELKKSFGVYGFFYQSIINGQEYPCRCTLEIVRHNIAPLNPSELYEHPIDMLVVMMNPGSSKPLDDVYKPQIINEPNDVYVHRELVPTRPDNTQYQIMKVMHAKKYQHARILNLSDLRESKSNQFIKIVEGLKQVPDGDVHSIFSDSRLHDLENLLGLSKSIPVIVGWGRDQRLFPLASQALKRFNGRKVAGVPANNNETLFSHPSPMLQKAKDAWLASILTQI